MTSSGRGCYPRGVSARTAPKNESKAFTRLLFEELILPFVPLWRREFEVPTDRDPGDECDRCNREEA